MKLHEGKFIYIYQGRLLSDGDIIGAQLSSLDRLSIAIYSPPLLPSVIQRVTRYTHIYICV